MRPADDAESCIPGGEMMTRSLQRKHQQPKDSHTLSNPTMQPGEGLNPKGVSRRESSTQVDLHPMETNIVKPYEWNEWELRRKAVKLADLRTRITQSMQTNLSHMRQEKATQTWLPKDNACQSKKDGESNVPKPQVYLAGLRGQRAGTLIKTNLTRAVDE